jgi:hypothetical protein
LIDTAHLLNRQRSWKQLGVEGGTMIFPMALVSVRSRWRILSFIGTLTAATQLHLVAAQTPTQISVEHLISDGWEIAGYTASSALSVSFILFKHKDHHYLMQCSVLYDATRGQRVAERVVTNCYEVR